MINVSKRCYELDNKWYRSFQRLSECEFKLGNFYSSVMYNLELLSLPIEKKINSLARNSLDIAQSNFVKSNHPLSKFGAIFCGVFGDGTISCTYQVDAGCKHPNFMMQVPDKSKRCILFV